MTEKVYKRYNEVEEVRTPKPSGCIAFGNYNKDYDAKQKTSEILARVRLSDVDNLEKRIR